LSDEGGGVCGIARSSFLVVQVRRKVHRAHNVGNHGVVPLSRAKALTDGQDSPGSPTTAASKNLPPALKLSLEKKAYRPGDTVVATVEIVNEAPVGKPGLMRDLAGEAVLMEDLSVEVRGIEKLDPQWMVTPKPPAGSKTRKGSLSSLFQS
jgi:hypothetical protein